jgi:hypothetical protein
MDSDRKIKVSVVIRKVVDRQDTCKADNEADAFFVLDNIKHLLNKTAVKSDDICVKDALCLLEASKLSNEIMADAFIDVDREDLLEQKIKSIDTIEDIINQIIKNI